jgi:hypothetical protein
VRHILRSPLFELALLGLGFWVAAQIVATGLADCAPSFLLDPPGTCMLIAGVN